ncbi:Trafficking protein particle complex subunit 8 [Quillaja saponaria]|uniref:Trafficking protein particle complex subunit 8 n=1 Tax=Quillaja saponaria TaxID=32244 RepID=A0AAD7KN78_QUISA|nr:Trafficking protein particle complex subunit 8 [Quillaja saponaria]
MTVDPANTSLGRMLLEEISPVVMVLSTPLVEEACLKNGLSFLQMLNPFSSFNNIDVPERTASDQPYRLQKFKLRLYYASDVKQPNLEVGKKKLKEIITQAGEKDLSELCSDAPQISNALVSSESGNPPSWFQCFNKQLVHMVSFSDHEAFDHPVACLLVASSKDEQPINRFVDLFNTNKLPSLLNDGAMDPKILKDFLLVHDNQDGPPDRATKLLAEMRKNPWAPYKSDASPSQHLGCFLNVDDISEKIRVLNQQVSATRKGFRNQIKNLWWRKGKEDVVDSPTGSMYTFSSIESQIRVSGDYAFMLRDYELALSNYRLISTDYKLDKAWKRYAGVQEMTGLTYFLLDQSRKEAEYCLENAFNTYSKLGSSGQQNATRCGLWWIEMLKTRDQYKEAAIVYFRVCGEDPLPSAVMLEQASYCYLLTKPSMLRKYGFHLVLAGDHYKKCDQIKHAIRTYRSAISVLKGTKWNHIKDHVHFHIGQWYASLEMYDVAVKHMLEVLACSHQSKTTQEFFLRDFLQIVQKTGKTFEVMKLQLPVINFSSLTIIFEDNRTYASPSAASTRESLWHSLEEEMIPSFSTARTNWLELQSKLIPKKYRESNVCVAGDIMLFGVSLSSFVVPLAATSFCFGKKTDEWTPDGNKLSEENDNDDNCEKLTTNMDISSDNSLFILSEVDCSLGAGETITVLLTVKPRVEGTLQIVGVRWKLSGSVVGFHNFQSNYVKKNVVKGSRKAKLSPNDNLKFMVIKVYAPLQYFTPPIQPLPEKLYAGTLQQLVLELRNQSEFPVKNLKMKVSHSRFLNIGNRENLTTQFPACLEKERDSGQSGALANSDMSHEVFLFPEDTLIQGEMPFLWPLWLRAAVPGYISLYISIYYEMGDISSVIRYRTLRLHYNLQVLPSLDVYFQISPSPLRLQQFLVRMDVVNRTSTESFHLHQLSSLGNQWEISLLQPPDSIFPLHSLKAGQGLSCFFMLKSCRKLSNSEDTISSISTPLASDVRLVPQGSGDSVYDITRSPLVDFHHCERLQQESSQQGDLNAIDFILISRTLKINADPGFCNAPHLISHHSCHCSVASAAPISWLVEGPGTLHHNFSSFCEVKLKMTIYNSTGATTFVRMKTFNSSSNVGRLTGVNAIQSATPGNQAGWHDVSLVNEIKVASNIPGTQHLIGKCLPVYLVWTKLHQCPT